MGIEVGDFPVLSRGDQVIVNDGFFLRRATVLYVDGGLITIRREDGFTKDYVRNYVYLLPGESDRLVRDVNCQTYSIDHQLQIIMGAL